MVARLGNGFDLDADYRRAIGFDDYLEECMTFVKGQRQPGQGGHNRWGLKFAAARECYEEKQRRKAEAKLSPVQKAKIQLERDLQSTRDQIALADCEVDKVGCWMRYWVDQVKYMGREYNLVIVNAQIESFKTENFGQSQFVREWFEKVKKETNESTQQFNLALSRRGGLMDRLAQINEEILKLKKELELQLAVQ
jgi:hypothetical protein